MDTIRCTIAFVRRTNYHFNYVTYVNDYQKIAKVKKHNFIKSSPTRE